MNYKWMKVALLFIGFCVGYNYCDLHDEIEEAEEAAVGDLEQIDYTTKDDEPIREERRRQKPIGNKFIFLTS